MRVKDMYDRTKTIGASDAPDIYTGNWQKLYDSKHAPDDLSAVLPVQMGICTEPLNRKWFAQETGLPVEYSPKWRDRPFMWPEEPKWCAATPDGLINGKDEWSPDIVLECKHVNTFWQPHALIAKYKPQLLHLMRVMMTDKAYLSVFYGNMKWECYEIPYDEPMDEELLRMERAFLWHLQNEERP
jgi:hypothetical protein